MISIHLDRAIRIPEILVAILEHLDSRTLLSCALVCKDWSNDSLDALWKELDSPVPLLLAPTYWDGELYIEFARPIRLEDWIVFHRYAPRVRCLKLDFKEWPISPRVFSEMAQKRYSFTILPNLTRLEIGHYRSGDLISPLLFMSKNVRELSFQCLDINSTMELPDESVSEFLKEASVRMPRIKVFELFAFSLGWSIVNIQEHVVKFLSPLKELKTFNSSMYFATSKIVSALSQLPELRVVAFRYPDKLSTGAREDVLNFSPLISRGAFPVLVDLSFSATFRDASRFLELDFATSLSMLCIHSPQLETEESMHQLFLMLSRRRPLLTKLVLSEISAEACQPLRDEASHEIDIIKLETIIPLLEFPNLVHIEIVYHRPFHLGKLDLQQFLMKRRGLEVLYLCSDPILQETPSLTPDALPIIAASCPKLRQLSLYLDTHFTAQCPSTNAVFPTRFARLEQIDFGTSRLAENDISSFALYLSELLPSTCRMEPLCGAGWFLELELFSAGFESTNPTAQYWKKAGWALNMLTKAREQERNRICELERKTKDLSIRVAP